MECFVGILYANVDIKIIFKKICWHLKNAELVFKLVKKARLEN